MRIWHQSFSDLDRALVYRATLARYAEAVMPPSDSVVLHGLRPGAYGSDFAPIHAMRHRYLEYLNEAQAIKAARAAEREGYDAAAGRAVAMGAEVVIPGDGFLNAFVRRHGLQTSHGALVMDALGTLFHHARFMVRPAPRSGYG